MNTRSSAPGDTDRVTLVQSLFIAHLPALRAVIIAMMPDADQVDDVVQETFLTVLHKAADFQPGTNFVAWASAIARYKVREALRKRPLRFEPLSEEVLDMLDAAAPPPDHRLEELRTRFEACLQQLAPRARQVMELRYHGGLLPAEIARHIRWSANAVRVALTRARILLKDCVHLDLQKNAVP